MGAAGVTSSEVIAVRAAPAGISRPTRPSLSSARTRPGFLFRAYKVGDVVAALAALCGALVILNMGNLPDGIVGFLALRITVDKLLLLGGFALLWNRAFRVLQLYRRWQIGAHNEDLARIAVACTLGSLPTLPLVLLSATGDFTPATVVLFWALSIPAVMSERSALRWLWSTYTTFLNRRLWDVLVVGSGRRAQAMSGEVFGPGGVRGRVVGFMDTAQAVTAHGLRDRWLGRVEDLEAVVMRQAVDEVLIALPIKSCYGQIQDVIHTCERLGIQCTYLADVFQPSLGWMWYDHGSLHTIKVVQDDFRLIVKRGIDLVGAAIGLLLVAPVLLVAAAAIKLTSPGPVFFVQRRYGLNKRLFPMLKLRTMVTNAEALQSGLEGRNEAQGPVFKIAEDPRITRVGRWLRRTSLDELPQLWNVLRGEMSLVGPRPLPIRDVGRFDEAWLMRRFSMRPGITCLWQVTGRSDVGFNDWVALDLKYIDEWSLRLDLSILLQTVPAVLAGAGAR
jgi:exopolysaccharide biosynthesis polyprenyl glycosylphosphotransferase